MLYIRFLKSQNSVQNIEKMYKDGDIKYGDIVCQQYNDKLSHLFMNGTWIKTLYNSKIKQNNEIEDDIEFLSTAIGNNSTNIDEVSTRLNDTSVRLNDVSTRVDNTSNNLNDTSIRLNDVSTRLKDDYVNKTQYLKDEELIASTFADLNNKINNVGNIDFSNYYNIDQINEKISNINTSTNDISTNLSNTSTMLNNTSIRLNDVSIRLNNVSTRLNTISQNENNTSTRLNDTSTRLNDTSVRLLNYLTINQYLKDEELIASTFADVNNKINSLYAEIAELKEQLKTSTK